MLYMLVVVVCLGGECEAFVWRDMVPGWECMDEAFKLHKVAGKGWYVGSASCVRMFKARGIAI